MDVFFVWVLLWMMRMLLVRINDGDVPLLKTVMPKSC